MATLKSPFRSTTPKLPPGAGPAPGATLQPPSGGLLGAMFGGSGGGDTSGGGWNNGIDDDPRSRINKLGALMMMLDPMTANAGTSMLQLEQNRAGTNYAMKRQNQTAQWLTGQGLGEQEASYLASDPAALKEWYTQWNAKRNPKWEMHEVYNDQGQKTQVMIDMNTGKYSPIGGHAPPNMEQAEIFDENSGMKRKVLINKDDPTQAPIPLGGEDTGMISQGALEQKKQIAQAGVTPPVQAGETENQKKMGGYWAEHLGKIMDKGDQAEGTLSTIGMMRDFVNSPGFVSGGGQEGSEMMTKVKQYGQLLGIPSESLGNMEAFTAQSNRLIHDELGSLGTGVSDADRDFIKNKVPNLGMSKQGNLALLQIRERETQHQQKLAQLATDYAAEHGGVLDIGFKKVAKDWAALPENRIFTDADKIQIMGLAKGDALERAKPKPIVPTDPQTGKPTIPIGEETSPGSGVHWANPAEVVAPPVIKKGPRVGQ